MSVGFLWQAFCYQANAELMATLEYLYRKAVAKMSLAASEDKVTLTGPRIDNPSGLLTYGANVRQENGVWVADNAGVYRTARCLMKGVVAVPRHLVG